jgi:hypothetical protein
MRAVQRVVQLNSAASPVHCEAASNVLWLKGAAPKRTVLHGVELQINRIDRVGMT